MKLIPLSRGKFAQVDDEDFELLNQWKWCTGVQNPKHKITYRAVTRQKGVNIKMHRFILGLEKGGKHVDHIDGDGLNNQKENLRLVTPQQNNCNRAKRSTNTSGFKGVSNFQGRYWRARIMLNQKEHSLGYFSSKEEAYDAYCKAAKRLFGEYARV